MKRIISYILISFIISANLLAPVSVGLNGKNIEVKKNITEARDIDWSDWDSSVNAYKNAFPNSLIRFTSSQYVPEDDSTILSLTLVVDTGITTGSTLFNWVRVKRNSTTSSILTSITRTFLIGDSNLGIWKDPNLFILKFTDESTGKIGYIPVTDLIMKGYLNKTINASLETPLKVEKPWSFKNITLSENGESSIIKPDTTYTIGLYYLSTGNVDVVDGEDNGAEIIPGLEDYGKNYYKLFEISQKMAGKNKNNQEILTGIIDDAVINKGQSQDANSTIPECSLVPALSKGSFMGCVVQGFYYVLFVPTSYLFALAGTMFDYTFSYSVQDTSYRSAFVVQGWGLIRDFCNMFFIFIMLYVAIGTILSLHSMKTKETIINVVIIGLFINFSLFATQVIIDASNITARVFYNSNAIKITEKGANGVAKATPGLEIGADGTIPLSAAIVNKVNPQNLIMSASKVSSIKNNNSTSGVGGVNADSLGVMQFILVIIMASAVNIVGFTVFITVAFLFIARVVGLWMAMILAPVAFFTYILPEMAGTKMIGWKNWWPETLKLAFLAPVFIFFMYLILKFLQADLITDIVGKSMSGDGLGYFVAILVPFAFIMILMMKAKKIAIDMSGEFGEMAVKAGSAVGGMALGGAVGIGAIAMRGTIGKMGAAVADSKFVRNNGAFGRALGDAGKWTASKSFDARNTKAGAVAAGNMGVDAGKGKTGGFTQARIDQKVKAEKRAKELELSENSPEKTKVRKTQVALKELENEKSHDINSIDGKLTAARQKVDDANKALAADPSLENKEAAKLANQEVAKLNIEKGNITNGGAIKDAKGNITGYHTTNGKITQKGLDDALNNETQTAIKLEDAEAKVMTAQSDSAEILAGETTTINDILKTELEGIKKLEDDARTAAGGVIKDKATSDNIESLRNAANTKATNAINIANTKAAEYVKTANMEYSDAEAEAIEAANVAKAARTSAAGGVGKSINELKFTDIPNAEHAVHKLENKYKTNYAKSQRGGVSKAWNYITTAGEYDFDAAEVAADNIITGTVTPKGSGGGHTAPAAHAPAATPSGGGHGASATPAASGGKQHH